MQEIQPEGDQSPREGSEAIPEGFRKSTSKIAGDFSTLVRLGGMPEKYHKSDVFEDEAILITYVPEVKLSAQARLSLLGGSSINALFPADYILLRADLSKRYTEKLESDPVRFSLTKVYFLKLSYVPTPEHREKLFTHYVQKVY